MFCSMCGAQVPDGSRFCQNCGNNLFPANTPPQNENNSYQSGGVQGNVPYQPNPVQSNTSYQPGPAQVNPSYPPNNTQGSTSYQPVNRQGNNSDYTMYEKFSPTLGLGKGFIMTDRSIIQSKVEYMYCDMEPIVLTTPPSALVNGVATTRVNGKTLTLAFQEIQGKKFLSCMEYANKQIDLAHVTVRKYKYVIQSSLIAKVEVYDDYIMIYYMKSGILNMVGNAFAGGATGVVVEFNNLDVMIDNDNSNIRFIFENTPLDIRLTDENYQTAQDIVAYINNVKAELKQKSEIVTTVNEKWEPFVGEERTFMLKDNALVVSKGMDLFNSYRLKFRTLASECADSVKAEYEKRIHNLVTFLEFYPKLYVTKLDILINKALDILIAESIWTVTRDSLFDEHTKKFHYGFDLYNAICEAVQKTSVNNQRTIAGITSLVPNLVGGGFGFKGAMKGVAKATAYNIVRDTAEASLVNSAGQINQNQQAEIYGRIKIDTLVELIYRDYWSVFLTLVAILKNNGKEMWFPSNESMQTAQNIFQNISNPNFPEEQKLSVFLQILQTNPYKVEYQKFMLAKWGENDQTVSIKNYFGFTDFNSSRLSQSD